MKAKRWRKRNAIERQVNWVATPGWPEQKPKRPRWAPALGWAGPLNLVLGLVFLYATQGRAPDTATLAAGLAAGLGAVLIVWAFIDWWPRR